MPVVEQPINPGISMRLLIPSALLLACLGFAVADDLSTLGGATFKNAQVIRYDADGVVVKHDGGTNHIFWKDLPVTARQRSLIK